jgi:hypothetical protein
MRCLLALTLAVGLISSPTLARAGETDDRVVAFLVSPDELIADVKHIVVELAQEEKAWKNNVLPNLEIWLFGVEASKPVALDVLFTPDKGRVIEFHVPIADRREFLGSNLGDVGVVVKKDASNPNLYKLSEVIEGWLLFTKDKGQEYGSIVTNKANLPKEPPVGRFTHFQKAGYEAGIRWSALENTRAERDKGFDKMLSEVTSNIKKRPEETNAQFELRKLVLEQNTQRLARMFTNTSELLAGWKTDAKARSYGGSSRMVGLPGTDVEKNIASIGTVSSKFAKVTTPENSAMFARVMLPLAEVYQKEQARTFNASLAALKERIDAKEDLDADTKAARKELSEKVVQIATDSLGLGWMDVYAELVPSTGSLYNGIVGVRVKDSATAQEIVKLLPRAQPGWNVKMNAEEFGGAQLHQVDMKGKLPSTLKVHFGEAGEAWVATGEETIWIAAGPEGLTRLKAALTSDGKENTRPVHAVMHVEPALRIGKSLTEDRDIELFRTLQQGTLLKGGSETEEKKPGKKDEERRVNRNALKNFKWHDTALKALEGGSDVVTLEVKKDGDALLGELKAEEGVMRAVGKVIAKFAVEMLQ